MSNLFKRFFQYLRYREAVKRADKAHAKNGERYYVMPTVNGKLVVMDRANFRIMKKKHYLNPNAKVSDLINECFYMTPYRLGNGYLDKNGKRIKLRLYFSWCDAYSKKKKQK